MNLSVFCLLVGIGIVGRLGEPDWCFTPLAAITLFSGYYFSNRWTAMLVPLSVMTISDLWLPTYQFAPVLLVVYVALLLPVVCGRMLRGRLTVTSLGFVAPLPATLFFLTTNLAVWQFQGMYPHTWTGLLACYAAAIPFFRNMLCGDAVYLVVLFGAYAWGRSRRSVFDVLGHAACHQK